MATIAKWLFYWWTCLRDTWSLLCAWESPWRAERAEVWESYQDLDAYGGTGSRWSLLACYTHNMDWKWRKVPSSCFCCNETPETVFFFFFEQRLLLFSWSWEAQSQRAHARFRAACCTCLPSPSLELFLPHASKLCQPLPNTCLQMFQHLG